MVDLIVIGGGAAGFFGAIQAVEQQPGMRVLILEKSNKVLAKVKVSGGGRCNVTHHAFDPIALAKHYPRGEKMLKAAFKTFHAEHMVQWLAEHGVEVHAEPDGRMFPISNNSQTIIDCFMQAAHTLGIRMMLGKGVTAIQKSGENFIVQCGNETFDARRVLITVGGNASTGFYDWIRALGHTVVSPIPSLFTFNDPQKKFADLMGVAVPFAQVRIAGTKFEQCGPVLITHWGLSGPAVIKLSAWAADHLHQQSYRFTAMVSWIGPYKEDEIRLHLDTYKREHGKQKVINHPLFGLPQRLWEKLCRLAEVEEQKIWAELPSRQQNKLLEGMVRTTVHVQGKTTFKDEFVTCGGVDLKEVHPDTLESRVVQNLYFAGEVLNVDGETGGFNFQAAWTTGHLAARDIAAKHAAEKSN